MARYVSFDGETFKLKTHTLNAEVNADGDLIVIEDLGKVERMEEPGVAKTIYNFVDEVFGRGYDAIARISKRRLEDSTVYFNARRFKGFIRIFDNLISIGSFGKDRKIDFSLRKNGAEVEYNLYKTYAERKVSEYGLDFSKEFWKLLGKHKIAAGDECVEVVASGDRLVLYNKYDGGEIAVVEPFESRVDYVLCVAKKLYAAEEVFKWFLNVAEKHSDKFKIKEDDDNAYIIKYGKMKFELSLSKYYQRVYPIYEGFVRVTTYLSGSLRAEITKTDRVAVYLNAINEEKVDSYLAELFEIFKNLVK